MIHTKISKKKFCFFFFLTTASNACWKLIFRQFTCKVTYSNLLAEKYCKIIKRHDREPILSQVSLKRFLCKCYSIINTNLRYVGAWIGSYFLKNKKTHSNWEYLVVFLAYSLEKSAYHYITVGVISPLGLQRGFWMLTYTCIVFVQVYKFFFITF